jgi:dihydropteroate synthase
MASSELNRSILRASSLEIDNRTFVWGERTYLMGILNLTSDSFSGDGLLASLPGSLESWDETKSVQTALEQAKRFVAAGVDFLDVGGESTRPGATTIDIEEELRRVVPVVRELRKELDVIISVDTYKHQVAEEALQAGAHIVNDVWGLRTDPDLALVAAKHRAPIILMHNRSSWAHAEIKERLGGHYVGVPYEDLFVDIRRELMESVDLARQAGIPDERIILDPGIGFGKTVEQNLELINELQEIRSLGYPLLIGPSRKSFIGYTLNLPPDQRLEGTAAAVAVSIVRGADIVRVHDVEFMAYVVRMTDAIVRKGITAAKI